MAITSFEGIGLSALAACVPKRVIDNYAYTHHFPKDMVKDIVDKVGIYERRFADEYTCSSDLCYAAAEQLIQDNGIDRSEIDLLIFISLTPDYRMPATSILLQNRLGLSNSCIAFDVTMGCSAFLYGLNLAYAMLQQPTFRKALILDGETRSKVYNPKDRNVAFLFGDGAVAALVEKDQKFGKSFFSLNSDGSRGDLIKIEAGGYRHMSSAETVIERVVDEHGNMRSMENGNMNGGDVFNFVIREVPKDIKKLLEYTGNSMDSFDYYAFHQANNFMNEYLIKKLKLDPTRVPSTIAKFGNTSSVSLPLTIASELIHHLKGHKKLLLSTFGVGLSWATGIIELEDCNISPLVEL